MGIKKKERSRNLAAGRPPTLQRPKSISRKATKALINSHHILGKRKAQALAKGNHAEVAAINAEISALGGLERYQQASLQGQRIDRGGDSSRVLMEWLNPVQSMLKDLPNGPLRMLEVGALSTTNQCSKSGVFAMHRIDLNSQGEGILQQDFMERPLPKDDSERIDIISLSLVLNFVPDAHVRGRMLQRTLEFLKEPNRHANPELNEFFPSLFLVLPAPCVTNSRYMDETRLEAIMVALGYVKVKSKMTQRLVYYLWAKKTAACDTAFAKTQVRTGTARNNFSIVLRV
ncbi:putative methyltransferase-domain-containing protein [Pseudomassariella vexata]|uniref:25S rRNA adenine-N(1) methyltransferase n=1 Tax=Pseudomassariella vexata TaxID=1141098 RepID=A0A1Y2DW41_9PEZI|nr:putative methyltransferase-domain-containing protein [Pseudomassariella vexata]ORY63510.1 putative methyltransferase-domain-containing protein [Pseudomassariella vexata]